MRVLLAATNSVISATRDIWYRYHDVRVVARRDRPGPDAGEVGLVSIVIPTYDRIELLATRTLPALLTQSYPHIEVLVVADGSPEASLRPIGGISDPRLRVIRLRRRSRYPSDPLARWMVVGARPRNVGASLARGQWIMWISDDDLVLPHAVETLMARAEENPQADVISAGHQKGGEGARATLPAHDAGQLGFPFGGTGWMMRASLRGCRWNAASWRKRWNRPSDYDLVTRLHRSGATFDAVDSVNVLQLEVPGTSSFGSKGFIEAARRTGDEGRRRPRRI